jgi:hypothetical protein
MPEHWGVYRLTREEFERIPRSEGTAFDRLFGMEVKIIDDVPGDIVYIIDRHTMEEATRRLLFPEMRPWDYINGWKVQFTPDA